MPTLLGPSPTPRSPPVPPPSPPPGVPPILAAMSLAYSINLFGSITHYASGQAAVFYGSGYMRLNEVFSMGAVCGFGGLAIWGLFGMPVWKLLGWW